MTASITFPSGPDLSGLHLERGPSGHCYSPWFSFTWREAGLAGPADCRSRYHQIIGQSKSAFASLLGIQEHDVMVTQKEDPDAPGEYWWRLGTKDPCLLPVVRKRLVKAEDVGAIDI